MQVVDLASSPRGGFVCAAIGVHVMAVPAERNGEEHRGCGVLSGCVCGASGWVVIVCR